jgi:8-oxo-dGTP pyrophosphatase MutT (NUDIX family)
MDGVPSHSFAGRAAAVCYRWQGKSLQFLLIQTAGGRWTFPKGRVEPEETPWQAAQREAFEEAGVRGSIKPELLTTYLHEKHTADRHSIRVMVSAYLLHAESGSDVAERERHPTWFDPDEAKRRLGLKRDSPYRDAYARVIDEARAKLASDNTDSRG